MHRKRPAHLNTGREAFRAALGWHLGNIVADLLRGAIVLLALSALAGAIALALHYSGVTK